MGLAASQARLLSLTSRIHDVEFQAQQIQSAKLNLALLKDKAYKEYNDALDAQSLTIPGANGDRIAATFENLCGLGSINNNIKNGAHYVFRTRQDNLIVPNDIYEAYLDYSEDGGADPYEFALIMIGADLDAKDIDGNSIYENTKETIKSGKGKSKLESLENSMKSKIKEIYESATSGKNKPSNTDNDKNAEEIWNEQDFLKCLLGSSIDTEAGRNEFRKLFLSDEDLNSVADKIRELQETYKTQYEYALYQNLGGAKEIYEATTGDETGFDQDTYNYYVRWAQMIELEGGINYCTNDLDLEKDAQLLNDNLMSGYIQIDVVYDKRGGGITDKPTSASTDSNVSFVNTSSIDSRILKKAEAAYQKKLSDVEKIDKKYDMDLNRLETERNALTTEYDSVKKVISDNVERTFGIFS